MVVLTLIDHQLWSRQQVKCFTHIILIFRNPYKKGIIDLILEMKKLKFKEIKEFTYIIQWWGMSAENIYLALWLQSHCDKPLSNFSSLWHQSQCDKSLSNSSSCCKLTLGNPANHASLTNGFFILPEKKECFFFYKCAFCNPWGFVNSDLFWI